MQEKKKRQMETRAEQANQRQAHEAARVALDHQIVVERQDAPFPDPPMLNGVFTDESAMPFDDDQMNLLM